MPPRSARLNLLARQSSNVVRKYAIGKISQMRLSRRPLRPCPSILCLLYDLLSRLRKHKKRHCLRGSGGFLPSARVDSDESLVLEVETVLRFHPGGRELVHNWYVARLGRTNSSGEQTALRIRHKSLIEARESGT